jgi:hypothetical protein
MDAEFYDVLDVLEPTDMWEVERLRVYLKEPENKTAILRVYSPANNRHLQDMIRKFEALPGITDRNTNFLKVIVSFVKQGRFHVLYEEARQEEDFPLDLSTEQVMSFCEALNTLHKFKISHGNISSRSFYRDINNKLLLGSFQMPPQPSFTKPAPITLLDEIECFLSLLKSPESYNAEDISSQLTLKKPYKPILFRSRNPAYIRKEDLNV